MGKLSMTDSFIKYFHITLADTPELLERIYRIRYEVYCKEFKFEREEDCPGQIEKDDYDEQSIHCLLLHNATGQDIGCGRLIMPDVRNAAHPLPFERFCKSSLNEQGNELTNRYRGHIGEFSRLAVIAPFRRRMEDEHKPLSYYRDYKESQMHGRGIFPLISLSLILAGCSMFMETDLDYCVAMMEPRLARLLRLCGLYFDPIGKVIDYHGKRGPFVIPRKRVLVNFTPDIKKFINAIHAQLYPLRNSLITDRGIADRALTNTYSSPKRVDVMHIAPRSHKP